MNTIPVEIRQYILDYIPINRNFLSCLMVSHEWCNMLSSRCDYKDMIKYNELSLKYLAKIPFLQKYILGNQYVEYIKNIINNPSIYRIHVHIQPSIPFMLCLDIHLYVHGTNVLIKIRKYTDLYRHVSIDVIKYIFSGKEDYHDADSSIGIKIYNGHYNFSNNSYEIISSPQPRDSIDNAMVNFCKKIIDKLVLADILR